MVADNVLLYILKIFEALKQSILEDSVELVLDTSKQSVLLVDVEAQLVERCSPVELMQIQ